MAESPHIFLIGFNRCGGAWFKSVFEGAGLRWRHDRTGELAASLTHAAATGGVPFEAWPNLRGVSGLERWNKQDLPLLEANAHYETLRRAFPHALFILNDRDPADWVASRFFHRDGRYREFQAWHRGVEEQDLAAIWLKERAAHVTRVVRFFGPDPRFLRFDVGRDPDQKLVDWARPFVRLGDLPADRGIESAGESVAQISRMSGLLKTLAARPRYRPAPVDRDFVDGVVAHCLNTLGEGGDDAILSPRAARWTQEGAVLVKSGEALPLVEDANGRVLAPGHEQARDRVQGVMGWLKGLGIAPPVTIDMQDARDYAGTGPARPTLVYNRRAGSVNTALWPLPGYHMLAPIGRPMGFAPDPFDFEEKPDHVAWVGNLTGRALHSLAPTLPQHRLAHQVLSELAEGVSRARRQEIKEELLAITRYRVVSRLKGQPGFDLGFVLPPKHDAAAEDPLIRDLVVPRRPSDWGQDARYVLSMSGNDTGSNFLPAVASNSLVLKEEDGWELFYTAAFAPWEHYVPLAPGADDLEEKLDWARSHQGHAMEMTRAARALFDKFAEPENQKAWMRAVAEEVAARQG